MSFGSLPFVDERQIGIIRVNPADNDKTLLARITQFMPIDRSKSIYYVTDQGLFKFDRLKSSANGLKKIIISPSVYMEGRYFNNPKIQGMLGQEFVRQRRIVR